MLNFGGVAQEKDSDWLGMRKDNISVSHQTPVSGFTSSTVIDYLISAAICFQKHLVSFFLSINSF